jgi:hypothetical protein
MLKRQIVQIFIKEIILMAWAIWSKEGMKGMTGSLTMKAHGSILAKPNS